MTSSSPLGFGLIGLGYFGKNYLRLLQSVDGAKLAAVATRTSESLSRLGQAIPKAAARTTDASQVLRDSRVDCVVIATPPSTHLQLAKEALENGKHVLLEKPMTPSLEEAKRLRAAVKKSSATFMVGHQYVYNNYIGWLRDNMQQLGKVSHVVAEHLYPGPVREDIGCLWDAGTHQLSTIQYLLNPGRIVEASGMSIEMSKKGIDDLTAATLRFGSGLTATMMVTWLAAQKTRRMTFAGSKGMAVFNDAEPKDKLKMYLKSAMPKPEIPEVAAREPLRNQVEHFIHCIRTGETPLTGIDKSYEVTEWLDRIARSVKKA